MKRQIKLALRQGDALDLPVDVVLISSRSRLRKAAELATRNRFRAVSLGGFLGEPLFQGHLLTSDSFRWRNTLSMSYTSRKTTRERQVGRVASALVAAHNLFRPAHILLTPLSWRHPNTVATCMLAAIYMCHYYSDSVELTRSNIDETSYTICDLREISPFSNALADDFASVRSWFDQTLAPLRDFGFGLGQMRFDKLTFDVELT